MNFKDAIKLNIFHLDKNAIDQVDLYEEWSDKWSVALKERDFAKEDLTQLKAEVDEAIRLNPVKYGWDEEKKSPTEIWIANRVALDKRVKEAQKHVIECQYYANKMSARKEVLEHRKKSLEVLTDLYKGNYFVSTSRTDNNYKCAVSEEGSNAQREALQNSERIRRKNGD